MKGVWRWMAGAAVIMLMAGAAWLWTAQSQRPRALPAESLQINAEQADPLTRFRTEREQLREKHRAELNDMIHSASTDEASLSLARQQLLALMASESAEVTLEGLLAARGFEDALVSVNAGAVYVMVRREALTQRETAAILDLVLRETGVTAGNVKILAEGQGFSG